MRKGLGWVVTHSARGEAECWQRFVLMARRGRQLWALENSGSMAREVASYAAARFGVAAPLAPQKGPLFKLYLKKLAANIADSMIKER